MRNIYLKLTFVLFLVTYGYIELRGEVINSDSNEERITLFTDRTLYISGEQIQFAAYLFFNGNHYIRNTDEQSKNLFSNIIYVELISPEGEKIANGKYLCEESYSTGNITIPKDITTGNYYIRAYTKFMRNYGPNTYCYACLKIVNPFKPDVLSYTFEPSAFKDSIISENSLTNQEVITISLNKKDYSARDSVTILIKEMNLKENFIKGLSLAVIPLYSFIDCNKAQLQVDKFVSKQSYYPEIDGISLTGSLKDSKLGNSLPGTIVNLSILGDSKDFMAVFTDSTGRFFFKMPNFVGVKDVFLCTETLVDSKSNILVDNDFCPNVIKLPTSAFHLTELERKTAYNMALNVQIASHFNKHVLNDSSKYYNKSFYGEPKIKLFFDKYIQLPTTEDYINELIPLLKIKKSHKKKYFKIYSTQSESEMDIYKPLVLLDLVAIDDPEKILSLPPRSISHIELVDAPYIKGDITYGGIISVFSKKSDFAGVDLPSSGVFLDFKFLSDCTTNLNVNPTGNQPDIRNTLFWEPNISFNSSGSQEFSFTTSDTPGRYIVLLRGVTNNGKIFTYKQTLIVKN